MHRAIVHRSSQPRWLQICIDVAIGDQLEVGGIALLVDDKRRLPWASTPRQPPAGLAPIYMIHSDILSKILRSDLFFRKNLIFL